jgi:hypothetical protein
MLSPEKATDRSGCAPSSAHPNRLASPGHRRPLAQMALLGLALCVSGAAVGCSTGGGPQVDSPEQKEKQGVVQDKMKNFMKESKLPNRPR